METSSEMRDRFDEHMEQARAGKSRIYPAIPGSVFGAGAVLRPDAGSDRSREHNGIRVESVTHGMWPHDQATIRELCWKLDPNLDCSGVKGYTGYGGEFRFVVTADEA